MLDVEAPLTLTLGGPGKSRRPASLRHKRTIRPGDHLSVEKDFPRFFQRCRLRRTISVSEHSTKSTVQKPKIVVENSNAATFEDNSLHQGNSDEIVVLSGCSTLPAKFRQQSKNGLRRKTPSVLDRWIHNVTDKEEKVVSRHKVNENTKVKEINNKPQIKACYVSQKSVCGLQKSSASDDVKKGGNSFVIRQAEIEHLAVDIESVTIDDNVVVRVRAINPGDGTTPKVVCAHRKSPDPARRTRYQLAKELQEEIHRMQETRSLNENSDSLRSDTSYDSGIENSMDIAPHEMDGNQSVENCPPAAFEKSLEEKSEALRHSPQRRISQLVLRLSEQEKTDEGAQKEEDEGVVVLRRPQSHPQSHLPHGGKPPHLFERSLSDDPRNFYQYKSNQEDGCGCDLDAVKAAARRLRLVTRRPSYSEWLDKLSSNASQSADTAVVQEGLTDNERKHNLKCAMAWLRKELTEMTRTDQQLARQLMSLRLEIQRIRLNISCWKHQAMVEEVTSEMEELKELQSPQICDLPLDRVRSMSPLRDLGVTRMNIANRRFSLS